MNHASLPISDAPSSFAGGTRAPIVRSSGQTDQGRVRTSNQDQFLIADLTRALRIQASSLPQSKLRFGDEPGHLFVVADGMGGHAGGEEASALALTSIEEFLLNSVGWLFTLDAPAHGGPLDEFKAALRCADARVCEEAARNPKLKGMGTTTTMALARGPDLFLAHVGDSRCYLLRDGVLWRLTHDHTLIAQLVQSGDLAPEQAAKHRLRHVITSCVGGPVPGLEAEVQKVPLAPSDVVLLCTDGLTEMVPRDLVASVLGTTSDPGAACQHLIELANERGGTDNVTVIVARFE